MRNKIVAGLLITTGVLFAIAAMLPNYENLEGFGVAAKLYQLGVISGISAIMTRLLIKEKV